MRSLRMLLWSVLATAAAPGLADTHVVSPVHLQDYARHVPSGLPTAVRGATDVTVRFPARSPAEALVSPPSTPPPSVDLGDGLRVRTAWHGPTPVLEVLPAGQYVTFGAFLTDASIFDHKELNEIRYELGRGFYSADSLRIVGLARSHGTVYTCVCWYSPRSSGQWSSYALVFRLNVAGQTVTPVFCRRAAVAMGRIGWPLLDSDRGGDLVLVERVSESGVRASRMDAEGRWHNLPPPPLPKEETPGLPMDRLELRGRFLMSRHDESKLVQRGPTWSRFTRSCVIVADVMTGRKIREFTWSVHATGE